MVELALRQHHRLVEDATDGRLGGQSAGGASRFREKAIATWRGQLPPSGQKFNGRHPYLAKLRIMCVNPDYETYERDAEEVNVIGRVVLSARRR